MLRLATYRCLSGLIIQNSSIGVYYQSMVSPGKILIIPNSVDCKDTYNPNINISNKQKLEILYIGRLEYQKGIDIIINALILISQQFTIPPFNITIVGDGSFQNIVENALKKNSLSKWCSLTKSSKNAFKYIKNSDIILLPSRYEGMSNILLETLSCGKCVIASKAAGLPLIKDQSNGILLENLSSQALSETIIKVINDKEILQNLAEKARDTALNYSDEVILKLWLKLI